MDENKGFAIGIFNAVATGHSQDNTILRQASIFLSRAIPASYYTRVLCGSNTQYYFYV
jgi:hypothetical protein